MVQNGTISLVRRAGLQPAKFCVYKWLSGCRPIWEFRTRSNGSLMEPRGRSGYDYSKKNIPVEIYERIKLQAKENRRSINSEIIAIFEQAIPKHTPMDVKEVFERARKVRELTAHYTATADKIDRWIKEGRE